MKELENEKLFNLYTLTEIAYKKHFAKKGDNINEIYPRDWYSNNNYQEKIVLMVLAIKNNLRVEEILNNGKILCKGNDKLNIE